MLSRASSAMLRAARPRVRVPVAAFRSAPALREEAKDINFAKGDPDHEFPGILGSLGLDDWRVAVPVGVFLATPAVALDWFVANEESQLLFCFTLFVTAVYTQAGPSIYESLMGSVKAEWDKIAEAESKNVLRLQGDIAASKDKIEVLGEMDAVYDGHAAMVERYKAALLNEKKALDRAHYAKVLDAVVEMERSSHDKLYTSMVESATANVRAAFEEDKKLAKSAMDDAIATLSGKPPAQDVVSAQFASYMKSQKGKMPDDVAAAIKEDQENFKKMTEGMGITYDVGTNYNWSAMPVPEDQENFKKMTEGMGIADQL
uniref:ATP synthase subunit b n=1 Tax=Phaeomonas parva TaxID=124430 RepID=A0A7S1U5I0_9STRA|mmetsp:Transcript_32057/g.102025  ORF Transcript_32057/g.102025 Transcript_32057/m.102025 type:complete len:317 (+) Transcript_32057:274-1224(+)